MSSPLFSIIIPVYNVEEFVHQAISSVLSQDFQDYEIIVIDDGSTDESSEICFNLAQKHSQISLIKKKNGGLSDARNYGLKIAEGEYIIFLDSDDYWDKQNVLSEVSRIIKRNNSPDLIIHSYQTQNINTLGKNNLPSYHIDESGLSKDYKIDFSELINRSIYLSNVWTKIVKRRIIIENDLFFIKGIAHEDSPWSFNLAKLIETYAIYQSNFYVYRIGREGSTTFGASPKRVNNLIQITYSALSNLSSIKEMQFYLYQGLFNYIAKDMNFLIKIFNLLSDEDRNTLLPDLSKCITIFNQYITKDFSVK